MKTMPADNVSLLVVNPFSASVKIQHRKYEVTATNNISPPILVRVMEVDLL